VGLICRQQVKLRLARSSEQAAHEAENGVLGFFGDIKIVGLSDRAVHHEAELHPSVDDLPDQPAADLITLTNH